jgi:hypothetical protein
MTRENGLVGRLQPLANKVMLPLDNGSQSCCMPQLSSRCSHFILRLSWSMSPIMLRRRKLIRMSPFASVAWSHVGDDAIVLATGKSRHRREAIIPLYGALRDVLTRIPKRATTILTSSRRRPWTADGFGSSFNKAKIDAGMTQQDLHFNDLRGTAATKFYIAGFSMREIAETLAWEEESVEKIIRRYVGRSAAIKARIKKLNEAKE